MIPAVYSLLAANALSALLLAKYNFEESIQCELLQSAQSGGNDLYLVTTSRERYVLRIYLHNSRTLQELEEDIRILCALSTSGISVSQPVPDREGNYFTALNAPEGMR